MDDFGRLFSRVQLQLGDGRQSIETTDQRIKSFAETEDPDLLALYFEFGRYLLISSSRPGGQPANLQGIWNEELLSSLEQQVDDEYQPGDELLAGRRRRSLGDAKNRCGV